MLAREAHLDRLAPPRPNTRATSARAHLDQTTVDASRSEPGGAAEGEAAGDPLQARLDTITFQLEALTIAMGALRLNLARLHRTGADSRRQLEALHRELARRDVITPRELPARRALGAASSCRELEHADRTPAMPSAPGAERRALDEQLLARELSRLQQQLAAFRFESHQEHQELHRRQLEGALDGLVSR